jgi:hypothetical protein
MYPTLNVNEIQAYWHNMIISIEMLGFKNEDDFSSLVSRAKVDGSLYGDTKVYRPVVITRTTEWNGYAEADKLLELEYQKQPEEQTLELDVFRKIVLTTDKILSKRAFHDAGTFGEYISIIDATIRQTKDVYDETTYNAFIGTHKSSVQPDYEIDVTSAIGSATGEEANRLEAQEIARSIANLAVKMKNINREYNDYKIIRKNNLSSLVVVYNSDYVNKITKVDLPTIFHKDGLLEIKTENILPSTYFGDVNAETTKGDGKTVRALEELEFNTVAPQNSSYDQSKHVFAGELVPVDCEAPAGKSYTVNNNVIAKVMDVKSVPFMSGFEVGSDFFNPRSQTTTKFLIWGHNTLDYIKEKPFFNIIKK